MNLADLIIKVGLNTGALEKDTKQARDKVEKFVDGVKGLTAAAGVAAGAALTNGFAKSLDADAAMQRLHAQIGAGSPLAEDAGKVAGSLYSKAYGESLSEVGDAVRMVVQSGALMEDASTEQIEHITAQALSLADAFDADVSESMRAVGQMVKTDMVKDAQEGMDLIAVAFRQFGPQAHDILDTFTEYSSQFQKIGLDGRTSLGLIQQMMNAGARSTDLAADALKEFSIRAVDGSQEAADSFKALGFDADKMMATFAKGGPEAEKAFADVIEALKKTEGQAEAAQIAFGLFGTQSEDLGKALYAMDLDSAVQSLGEIEGVSEEVNKTLSDTAQSRITEVQRAFDKWTASLVTAEGPLGAVATNIAAFGGEALESAGSLGMVALALRPVAPAFIQTALSVAKSIGSMILSTTTWVATTVASGAKAAASMAVTAAKYVGRWVFMAAGAMARAGVMAAAWLVAMGPVGWVITVVVALVALIIANWDTVVKWTKAAWDAVGKAVSTAWDWIKSIVGFAVDWVRNIVTQAWNGVKDLTVRAWNGAVDAVRNTVDRMLNFVRGLPGMILGALGNLGGLLWDAGKSIITGLWNGIKSMGGWLTSKILGFVKSAVPGPVLNFLGIHSPSRLFADIGKEVPAGLALGIDRASGLVAKAAEDMARSAVVGVGAGPFALTSQYNGATPTVPGSVNASVTRTGRDNAITWEVRSSGRTADDLIAELIRRYVRINGHGNVQAAFGR